MAAFNRGLEEAIQPGHLDQSPTSTTSSQMNLSQNTFKNPQEFLNVLRKDFKQIAGQDDLITKEELLVYSAYGEDREGRTAAKIALKHFDEMNELARFRTVTGGNYNDHEINKKPVKALSAADLEVATDMNNGDLTLHIALQEIEGVALTLGCGLVTAGLGAITVAAVVDPVVAIPFGLGTVAMAGTTGYFGYNTYNAPEEIRALSRRDKAMLASWPEINSVTVTGSARP